MKKYHKTRSKGLNKSCRICAHYKEGACFKFKIVISSLNNATHCTGYERKE